MASVALVARRLDWIRKNMVDGYSISATVSHNVEAGTQKIKFIIDFGSRMYGDQSIAMSVIEFLESKLSSHLIWDKGHGSHSASKSYISFWLKQRVPPVHEECPISQASDVEDVPMSPDVPPVPPPPIVIEDGMNSSPITADERLLLPPQVNSEPILSTTPSVLVEEEPPHMPPPPLASTDVLLDQVLPQINFIGELMLAVMNYLHVNYQAIEHIQQLCLNVNTNTCLLYPLAQKLDESQTADTILSLDQRINRLDGKVELLSQLVRRSINHKPCRLEFVDKSRSEHAYTQVTARMIEDEYDTGVAPESSEYDSSNNAGSENAESGNSADLTEVDVDMNERRSDSDISFRPIPLRYQGRVTLEGVSGVAIAVSRTGPSMYQIRMIDGRTLVIDENRMLQAMNC